ncbi:YidC/Oxa1 family insertase periplasmic-domain containing protein [Staphylococcus epidermidis]|nr:YidC/Oxa1 family insertase periplasmic-domain containing protein [Staphylococcus epidermidis]
MGGVLGQDSSRSARPYAIDVQHDVVNTGTTAVNPQLYTQLVRDGNKPEHESTFYPPSQARLLYTEAKKYHKLSSDIGEQQG